MANPDEPRLVAHERVVLRKFDGEPSTGDLPTEVVLVEDGELVQRWTGEDVVNAPTE